MRNYDHTYTDEIICPHCGYEHSDSWEYEGNDGVIECGNCEKPFSYCRDVSVTYSTHKEEYEICPKCHKEEVLEEVSCHSSLLKYTTYNRLCEDCAKQIKWEVFKELTNKVQF